MLMTIARRFRGAMGAIVLAVAASLAAPALSSDNLSSAAMQRMVDSGAIVAALEGNPDGRVPVIVSFEAPEIANLAAQSLTSAGEAAEAADAALTAAIHGAQGTILGRVLDLPDASALSAAMDSEALNIKRMDFLPMFAITADAALLERLAADPMVESIHLDAQNEPFLTTSLPLIGMPAAYAGGATGSGWHVAVLDTGGRRSHEFLNARIVSAACYSTNSSSTTSLCPGGAASSIHIDSANDCDPSVANGCGHGTHVAGIAGGFFSAPRPGNPSSGVSRDGRIISINVFSRAGGSLTAFDSDIIAGLNRVYALRNTYNIAAVNLSLGVRQSFHTTPCDTHALKPAVDLVRSAGIAPIFAAGNDGFSTGISRPACISTAIAVASSTYTDLRSSFSNWGTLIDLVAPGGQIVGNTVTEGILSSYVSGGSNINYARLPGTSMAAPHVAGAFTALRSAVPNASINQILSALQTTGTPITVSSVTRGRINVDRALSTLTGAIPTTTTLTGPASSTQGQSVTFSATVSATSGGTPAGTVTFRNNGVVIGSAATAVGVARLTLSTLPVGTNQITAAFGGSATHGPSNSNTLTHTVTAAGGPANDNFADRITIPAPGTVTGNNVGATAEVGEPIHARISSARNSVWWRYTPGTSGQVVIDTVGSTFDTVLAVYTGSAVNALTEVASNDDAPGLGLRSRVEFAGQAGVSYAIAVAGFGGASGNITLNVSGGGGVGPTPTTTTLSGPSSSVFGESVTFSAAVSATTGTPTGTVTFRRGGSTIGIANLSGGNASITTSTLLMGTDSVTAEYGGSGTHAGSTSSPRSHTVSEASVSVDLSVPGGVVRPGAPARLSATVSAVAPGGGTPMGTVRFSANGTTVGTAMLSSGRATLSTPLPQGENSVVAHYLGTTTHLAAQSAARTVLVSAVMGPEITVNQRTRHNQQRPAIASLGRAAVVVFEDQLVAGGPFGITAQRVNWAGQPNGDAIDVAPPAGGTGFPHVAQMAGGSFVVVWEAAGVGQDIFMRRFRANGRGIDGIPQRVNTSTAGNQTAPRVAGLEDGGYAVVWQSDRADGSGDGILLRIFEASGAPRTGEIVVNATTAGDQRGPDVAMQQGGDLVVSWGGPSGSGFGAFARRVSVFGTPMGGEIAVGRSGTSLLPQVRIAALDNGNFAVAHEASDQLTQPGPYRVMVQRLRQRGPLWGDAVPMARVLAGDQRTPAITGLRRMGLATAWRAPDGGLNGVWVQTVGRDGTAIGAPEMVNATIPGNQFDPAVGRVGTTRNYFVVWTASGVAAGDGTNIIIRRFMGP